ncbi:hypothetical protein HMPREF9969_1748 [Prevotella sp. oral taxon 306 str. F0472]|nr:hypothetical protein HMPREF9969_1748 [Prevotella sp. oral taxon 306 str. F0472]
MFANKEGVPSVQRKALFNTKKRPSPMEKGVSYFLTYEF